MGELELHNAAPNGLYNLLVEGVPPGKQQVLTMPKSSNASFWYLLRAISMSTYPHSF